MDNNELEEQIAHYRKTLSLIRNNIIDPARIRELASRALDKYPEPRRLNPPIYPYEPNKSIIK